MYIIAGLGNPGKDYETTRHNAGFMTIDRLADQLGCEVTTRKFQGLTGSGFIGGEKVILLKPQTFMNASGESIRAAADFYKLEPDHILVIYDDISLDVGSIRVRVKGSAGGHNGMKSIIAHLGTENFPRIRVGIGEKPERMDLADYVLGHFSKEEMENLQKATHMAAEAAEILITQDAQTAMNRFNKVKKETP
jgi:PTH1 family peptidyl-tRNA hydrolase